MTKLLSIYGRKSGLILLYVQTESVQTGRVVTMIDLTLKAGKPVRTVALIAWLGEYLLTLPSVKAVGLTRVRTLGIVTVSTSPAHLTGAVKVVNQIAARAVCTRKAEAFVDLRVAQITFIT